MSRFYVILRFTAATVLAGALVFFGAGWLVYTYVGHQPDQTVGLTVIRGIQLLSHVPGQATSTPAKKPRQMIKGFVQVSFTVGADGRAHDIHVLAAEPPGQYEEAARTIIASRHYKPAPPGKKRTVQRTEIIHFQAPAAVLMHSNGKGG